MLILCTSNERDNFSFAKSRGKVVACHAQVVMPDLKDERETRKVIPFFFSFFFSFFSRLVTLPIEQHRQQYTRDRMRNALRQVLAIEQKVSGGRDYVADRRRMSLLGVVASHSPAPTRPSACLPTRKSFDHLERNKRSSRHSLRQGWLRLLLQYKWRTQSPAPSSVVCALSLTRNDNEPSGKL